MRWELSPGANNWWWWGSQQLPPTSFFDRSVESEDDDDAAALSDTDSILDAALPLFPMRRLRWHYRSRHEKLIAYPTAIFITAIW